MRQREGPRLAEHPLFMVARDEPQKRNRIAQVVGGDRVVEALHVRVVPVARHPALRIGAVRDDLRPGAEQALHVLLGMPRYESGRGPVRLVARILGHGLPPSHRRPADPSATDFFLLCRIQDTST